MRWAASCVVGTSGRAPGAMDARIRATASSLVGLYLLFLSVDLLTEVEDPGMFGLSVR